MKDDDAVGYCQPPKDSRWTTGQSGNPKGRPKKLLPEILADAATILSEPVTARTPEGRQVALDAIEAGYLALCKNGLKGHKTSLLEAIRIMLDVGAAAEEKKKDDLEAQRIIDEIREKVRRANRKKNL